MLIFVGSCTKHTLTFTFREYDLLSICLFVLYGGINNAQQCYDAAPATWPNHVGNAINSAALIKTIYWIIGERFVYISRD